MAYEIVFGDGALARVEKAKLPVQVVDFLEREFQRLAYSPTTSSYTTCFSFPPLGQRHGCYCDLDFKRYSFAIFFFYGADEQSLRVFDVTIVVEDLGPEQ